MAIRWDKFTIKSQEAVQAANAVASDHGNPELLPLHLLSSLLADREGVILPVLEKLGVPTTQLDGRIKESLAKLPKVSGGAQPAMGNALQRVLDQASKEAETFHDDYVSTEHLLLALASC
jgi:ATP-dependent Clp protease ATP-binding subunit ClpB